MPNLFSYFALFILWPLVTIWLYRTKSIPFATVWTIMGGYMVLPVSLVNIDLPMIPPLDKNSFPSVLALIALIIKKQKIRFFSQTDITQYILYIFLLIPYITAYLNQDVRVVGPLQIQPLTFYDALSVSINQFLILIPFIIGRMVFKSYESQLLLFKSLVNGSLVYTIFILFELRFSPQLHTWIYGFFPHPSFEQQIRGDGFRSVVFMGHGLLVSFSLLSH